MKKEVLLFITKDRDKMFMLKASLFANLNFKYYVFIVIFFYRFFFFHM